jgi:hypothetical protein
MEYINFINDEEKMVDFFNISKDEFLQSYSYLNEKEYNLTLNKAIEMKLDWINNFLSIGKFAKHYNVSENLARLIADSTIKL